MKNPTESPPTLPLTHQHSRIDMRDRRMGEAERERVKEDLASGPLGPVREAPRTPPPFSGADALAKRLVDILEGEVRFDAGSRALYATDASNYRQIPIGVVIPKNSGDIVKTVALAREFHAPILSRGGGTSLAGECCNTAVVMDMSKYYNQILEINADEKWIRVQPGIVLDRVNEAVKPFGLIFGPDPATHSHCTIGGMIGNNSCGMHAQMAGRTEHNVIELDILTYGGSRFHVGETGDAELAQIIKEGGEKGRIYEGLKTLRDRYGTEVRKIFPDIPRKVSGYNLDNLLPEKGFQVARALVGTESTCVVILEAKLRLMPDPTYRALVIIGFDDIATAGDHVVEILKFNPIAFEGIDETLVEHMKRKNLDKEDMALLPRGNAWLIIEFGDFEELKLKTHLEKFHVAAKSMINDIDMVVFTDREQQQKIWKVREHGLGGTARVPGEKETWPGWEDSAVAPEQVGPYLRGLQALYAKYGYSAALYGHFGQGCIHTRIDFDLVTAHGIEKYRQFAHEAAHLVLKHGGSLSGEHGDGQSRGELLPLMFGAELTEAFRQFKGLWDPLWMMNPGKVVDPYRIDQNLRLSPKYNPPVWKTKFSFSEDGGSLAKATTRCVGVGECRREKGGVMCPSYMVTQEEKHSTRGRAHLFFEMLEGSPLKRTWRQKQVREALDLCLACKGCKSDCPVNVDMATYKAEFFHQYYKRRLRPITGYAMGLIYWWARLATHMPGLVNWLMSSKLTSGLAKRLGGIASERRIPSFAKENFRDWFNARSPKNPEGQSVLLWVDTFNNYFHPQVAKDALAILESAGFKVRIPGAKLCCGRPLYDFGMLDLAKHKLEQVLEDLKSEIEDGVPVVGIEPSCTAVFRDELKNLFPHRYDAKRLSLQTFLLPEFMGEYAEAFTPMLNRGAREENSRGRLLLHVHCHQHAIMNAKSDISVLKRLGFKVEHLDSGCCGMAGSFGFEREHYAISKKIGERVLIPAVKAADINTPVVTNGFSCREQIEQLANRQPIHFATLVKDLCV